MINDEEIKRRIISIILDERVFNARDVARVYNSNHDWMSINWHEFSDYLAHLYRIGMLVIDHIDSNGMNNYRWTGK